MIEIITGSGGGGGGSTVPSANDFRLTLSSGNPAYAPLPATPSSVDGVNNQATFSPDPAYSTGTIVTPETTGGNLTLGTRYWLRSFGSGVYAFYANLANANSDTSRLAINSGLTSVVIHPSGIESTTVYLSPYVGNSIGLNVSSVWTIKTSIEVSLALGTLTSGLPYDVFAFWTGSAVNIELLAWTSNTARATALSRNAGIWTKSSDVTRRYVGTIYTATTTTTIDDAGGLASQTGGKRYVWNAANRVRVKATVTDTTSSWTYASATIRQANGAAGNKVEFVLGLAEDDIVAELTTGVKESSIGTVGIGVDSATAYVFDGYNPAFAAAAVSGIVARWDGRLAPGYHFLAWLEADNGGATLTVGGWLGTPTGKSGLTATIMA